MQALPEARRRLSLNGRGPLVGELSSYNSLVASNRFDIEPVTRLLREVVNGELTPEIWNLVQNLVTQSTPPPRPMPYLLQTPRVINTSSFVNTSEHRKYIDGMLKAELGSHLYTEVPHFYETFFGKVKDLESAAADVFEKCQTSDNPRYSKETGWRDWPQGAEEKKVFKWFATLIKFFLDAAEEGTSASKVRRRLLAQPDQPLQGSIADRKLDIGFANDWDANQGSRPHWTNILVPGELKSNRAADGHTQTWLDLARYAREVFGTQYTRRFVLGFTLCRSTLRLWEFDRLGGIASSSFDINKEGLRFVSVMLGYLWMTEEQLGFDPTIIERDGKQYVDIVRNGQKECLILQECITQARCVAGRATTCWKGHREGDASLTPLVIKDSWQYPEREEGKLLSEATKNGVRNVARYYHHETVQVGGQDDDICQNVRKGLDIMAATNHITSGSTLSPNTPSLDKGTQKGWCAIKAGQNRSCSRTDTPLLPPMKRTCSSSPKGGENMTECNRVHRRVILSDYGKLLYKASSRVAMLTSLSDCIEGYKSLYTLAGILHSDISVGNLMMNEDDDNPSWRGFIIDLDFAIKVKRHESLRARGKTGTKVFMAIGVLHGEKHSFMHDLESFFWVLFWICIHYDGPEKRSEDPSRFEKWNYADTVDLADSKAGVVAVERDFLRTAEDHFTSFYRPLIVWINRLRRVVFPMGERWETENEELYSQMTEVLRKASEDPEVDREGQVMQTLSAV